MKVVITGGGTGGHVIPNLPVIDRLTDAGAEVYYAGTAGNIEETIAAEQGLSFLPIRSGKLRRYFDLKNFTDIFRILLGISDSVKIMKKINPDVVFSKGGFVSCPVVWASRIFGIPSVIHESDYSPGLANRLSIPFAAKICYTFEETAAYLNKEKAVHTGLPVRKEILTGDAGRGLKACGFTENKAMITVMGGSQGSAAINKALRGALYGLTPGFNICHICGRGNIAAELEGMRDYRQFEFIGEGLGDIFAATSFFIARAGATSICEFAAAGKPSILIPLPKGIGRGDQILNAKSFESKGYSILLEEEKLDPEMLLSTVSEMAKEAENYRLRLASFKNNDPAAMIAGVIQDTAAGGRRLKRKGRTA
ncbi:MAG: undecaprenyldiphospho-muramoylpentapeptide beta-N-acetylglucosaminyltransferase [Eubacteriales bacterium]|nr:undecaprenyldiphospho-muramoylpentapeptide beta-N-acetylglucosaminyltransferase [Eubacteriales bacterium]